MIASGCDFSSFGVSEDGIFNDGVAGSVLSLKEKEASATPGRLKLRCLT